MKKIRLKAKLDRRFRSGHHWVYSNELQESPKQIEPGEPLELLDSSGKFLAWGYGNPASLITFRTVSRIEAESDALSPAGVARRLEKAWQLRRLLGFSAVSHRLCFGEADQLPGLIADYYVLQGGGAALVVQAQTAGADSWTRGWGDILAEWRKLHRDGKLDGLTVVIKNDSLSRKREGLSSEAVQVLSEKKHSDLSHAVIRVRSADFQSNDSLLFDVDLLTGQKTGFFLDQWANTQVFLQRLEQWPAMTQRHHLRVLDLCTYVGQWGSQVSRFFSQRGLKVEVTLVDASKVALAQAEGNVLRAGAQKVELVNGDVLKDLGSLPDQGFDLVISDPPALIKSRKDIPTGTHAYLQLHTQAARVLAKKGAWVACSCSGLLDEPVFLETLAKASRRQERGISWVARGGQSPDHPLLSEFPEGRYLKAWLGMN